ncbi:MAG: hypothetical protein ACYCR9_07040 [Cuniculiplasma sp.]
MNESKPTSSVVIQTSSNGVTERAEPVVWWRRQYHASTNPARMHGRFGVTGLACGEGYSRQDGRSHIFPVRGMEYTVIKNPTAGFYHVFHNPEVNPAISRSEMPDNEVWEVRRIHSSDEFSVMERDAKGSDFCKRFPSSSWLSELPERKGDGIEHEQR